MALAIRIYRLVDGCKTGYVTRRELGQGRRRLVALAWLKRRGGRAAMVKWLAWELGQVMLTWLRGEGDLPGLLAAWWDVASGRVVV